MMPSDDDAPVTAGFDGSFAHGGIVWTAPIDSDQVWTNLGHATNPIEITYQPAVSAVELVDRLRAAAERVGRPPRPASSGKTPGQATTGGVVDSIDAAVDNRCACGCGRSLASDGPSAWFYDQHCQRNWTQRHATDPDDVYRRTDAHGGNIDPDAPGCRRRVDPAGPPEDLLNTYVESVRRAQAGRRRLVDMLTWRRLCPSCGQRGEPVEARAARERPLPFNPADLGPTAETIQVVTAQACRRCGYAWPGPPIRTAVCLNYTWQNGYVELRMEREGDSLNSVSMTISAVHLDLINDPNGYVDRAWDELEHQLSTQPERDRRAQWLIQRWHNRWTDSLPFSSQVMHPDDITRLTGLTGL